jgi:hypothetical protein
MKPKTLELVTRHGNSLLAAFPEATEQNPVNLCRKLRRIEAKARRFAVDYCNGEMIESHWNAMSHHTLMRVRNLLGISDAKSKEIGLFVNGDPRGYALKLNDLWTSQYNKSVFVGQPDGGPCLPIHTDWGGYGILAPDLND